MKYVDLVWGVLLTIMVYAIMFTLSYQVITNEDLRASIFIGITTTIIIRFTIAKLLQGVEADFNIIRDGITAVILAVLTNLYYE